MAGTVYIFLTGNTLDKRYCACPRRLHKGDFPPFRNGSNRDHVRLQDRHRVICVTKYSRWRRASLLLFKGNVYLYIRRIQLLHKQIWMESLDYTRPTNHDSDERSDNHHTQPTKPSTRGQPLWSEDNRLLGIAILRICNLWGLRINGEHHMSYLFEFDLTSKFICCVYLMTMYMTEWFQAVK